MAHHETKAEEHREEEEKKREHRRRGGAIGHKEREKHDGHKGRHHRKAGGHVPGAAAKHRPDRRARGGATADANPMSSAGRMSTPEYEHDRQPTPEHGKGADRD